jgi:hypothetical protein
MTSDPLAARVRKAVDMFAVPTMPAPLIAARIAAERTAPAPKRSRPVMAIAGGAAVLAAALAVAVPTADRWMTPAYYATLKRLTGHDFSHAHSFEVAPMTLEHARRLTTFPIVAPRGKRVLNAIVLPHDEGVSLTIAVDVRGEAELRETWVGAKRSKLTTKLEGVGIHSDGSIRRFNVRRWRIGRVEFSMPMFTLDYHRYAEEVERATREAAAEASKPPGLRCR